MIERQRLPNRRRAETVDLQFDGHQYQLTIGFYDDGRLGCDFFNQDVNLFVRKFGSRVERIGRYSFQGIAKKCPRHRRVSSGCGLSESSGNFLSVIKTFGTIEPAS